MIRFALLLFMSLAVSSELSLLLSGITQAQASEKSSVKFPFIPR